MKHPKQGQTDPTRIGRIVENERCADRGTVGWIAPQYQGCPVLVEQSMNVLDRFDLAWLNYKGEEVRWERLSLVRWVVERYLGHAEGVSISEVLSIFEPY